MANTEQPEISVNGWNADYIESLYSQWSEDPSQMDEQWQQFFQGFDLGTRILEETGEEDGEIGAAKARPETTSISSSGMPQMEWRSSRMFSSMTSGST